MVAGDDCEPETRVDDGLQLPSRLLEFGAQPQIAEVSAHQHHIRFRLHRLGDGGAQHRDGVLPAAPEPVVRKAGPTLTDEVKGMQSRGLPDMDVGELDDA